MAADGVVLGLDVGTKRVGVARGLLAIGIASPLTTLATEQSIDAIVKLCAQEQVTALVIGLPRNLSGDATEQTSYTERYVTQLQAAVNLPIYRQDEALTSQKAEAELRGRGKPFEKGDVDALAATYILEDFLQAVPEELHG